MKKSFWIFLLFTIIIMVAIFCFSHQDAEESTKTSDTIVDKIVNENTYDPSCGKSIETVKEETEVKVRKTAHFTLFSLLGFFVFMTFFYSDKLHKDWILIIASLIFCIVYATSDELHQLSIDGRSCEFKDILIDSAGSLAGILIAFLLQKIKNKRIVLIKSKG